MVTGQGVANTAVGANTAYSNSGYGNTAVGVYSLGGGDNGTIRIGTPSTQTATFIAGIGTTQLTGAAVYVNSSGQLGVLPSSERYKTDVRPMDPLAEKLAQLRPVTFHLKSEPDGALQYGPIAEEVATVYPDLVIRDAAGTIQGVRYDELASMLLKQVQQERQERLADRAATENPDGIDHHLDAGEAPCPNLRIQVASEVARDDSRLRGASRTHPHAGPGGSQRGRQASVNEPSPPAIALK